MSLALKVLIVEDETPAAEKLERYLNKFNPAIQVIEKLGTVKETVSWLQSNQSEIDLIFMDIQLHDGLSFQIFKQVDVQKPVIFITAYDEFAQLVGHQIHITTVGVKEADLVRCNRADMIAQFDHEPGLEVFDRRFG